METLDQGVAKRLEGGIVDSWGGWIKGETVEDAVARHLDGDSGHGGGGGREGGMLCITGGLWKVRKG